MRFHSLLTIKHYEYLQLADTVLKSLHAESHIYTLLTKTKQQDVLALLRERGDALGCAAVSEGWEGMARFARELHMCSGKQKL